MVIDRDEPARVAQFGAGVEGDGFPIAKIAAKLAVGYRWTRFRTTLRARRRRASSRRSIMWW
jgi:predicted alpha/beta-hydrolase family hydrolase